MKKIKKVMATVLLLCMISSMLVVPAAASEISASEISLNYVGKTLAVGGSFELKAAFMPEGAAPAVTWSSSDANIAAVNESGIVTGLNLGTAVITASAYEGQLTAECTVSVVTETAESPIVYATGISLGEQVSLSLEPYGTATLVAAVAPENATNKFVAWVSSDESVVAVDENGNVYAVGVGSAVVSAIAADADLSAEPLNEALIAKCQITVSEPYVEPTPAYVAVNGITISNTELSLTEGESANLSAAVNADATNQNIYWTVDVHTIASVDNGYVTALSAGNAVIYAISEENGNIYATCNLTVNPAAPASIPVSTISIDTTELTLTEGENANLSAAVNADATNQNIYWTVDVHTIASVDNGYVTALSAGNAVIYAISEENGNIYATCNLTVNPAVPASIPVSTISIDTTELTLTEGESANLNAAVNADATNQNIYWTVDVHTIASVDNGYVTALSAGNAVIYAISEENGNIYATCNLTVNPAAPASIPVSTISIDTTELTLTEGESANLSAAVNADATNQNIYWTVDVHTVASVENGYVTALSAGNAVIYAVSEENGNIYATCNLTVNPAAPATVPATSVTLEPNVSEFSMKVGEYVDFTASVNAEATDKTYYWYSDDASVASVDNGRVTAVGSGRTDIYAIATGDTAYAKCTVIVTAEPLVMFAPSSNNPDEQQPAPVDDTSYIISVSIDNDGKDWSDFNLSTAELNNTPYRLCASIAPYVDGDPILNESYQWKLADGSTGIQLSASNTGEGSDVQYLKVVGVGSGSIIVSRGTASKTITYEVLPLAVEIVDGTGVSMGSSINLDKGASIQLYSKVNYGENSVVWSGAENGISVDANGLVTVDANAVPGAKATITVASAIDSNAKDSIEIIVNFPVITPVTGVSLDKSSLELTVGDEASLTATVEPSDAANKNVTWTSNNEAMVTVDNGTVKAVAAGRATITATTEDGGWTASCEVTVSALPTVSIVCDQGWSSLVFDIDEPNYEGLSAKLSTGAPEAGKDFKWNIVGNPGVVSLSANGDNYENCVIDIVGVGTTQITASYDGITSEPYSIEVQKIVKQISIPTELSLKPGESYDLNEKKVISPTDPTNSVLTWSSTDISGKISVNESTGIVTVSANAAPGSSAKVYASATDLRKTTSNECTVTVIAATVPVTSVTITRSIASLAVGQTFKFEASVNPSNATDKTIQWFTSNPAIAHVDSNSGLVTAKGNGTAQIWAKAGGIESTRVNLTVSLAPSSTGTLYVTASPQTISTVNGYSVLTASVNGYVINGGVNWSVSDPNMATVSSNGVVTAKRAGSFVVTGIYDNNGTRYTGNVLITATPVITSGNYSNYDGRNVMYFKTNQPYPSWRSTDIVSVNGVQLTHGQHCYVGSSQDGYVLVALNPQYLNTLPGSVVHTIRIGPASAPAVGYFRTYSGQGTVINGVMTGDENQAALWAALCMVGLLGCATILISRRKDWD